MVGLPSWLTRKSDIFSILEIFFINVRGSDARRESVESLCRVGGIKCSRVDAVTPLDEGLISSIPEALRGNNVGQVAVLLSWLRALEKCQQSHSELVVVTEDDAVFDPSSFLRELTLTISQLPNNWEGLHLGTSGIDFVPRLKHRFMGQPWPTYNAWRPGEPLYPGAPDSLLLKKSSAKKFEKILRSWFLTNGVVPIDVMQGHVYHERSDLSVFVADSPQLFHQGNFRSEFSLRTTQTK